MQILSLEFLALAAGLVLWVRLVRGPLRLAGFLAGSLLFAASHLTPLGRVTTSAFILAGFAGAQLARRRPAATGWVVALLVAAFLYLRGYDLVLAALPEHWWTHALQTAGLSYLLFKILHVVVDAAGGRLPPLPLPLYLAYCFNFTAFLLGPIQRYPDFFEQWVGKRDPLAPGLAPHLDAANRVLRGLLKKFVVAEWVARFALLPGASIEGLSAGEVVLRTWGFYFYLYFDFSGYCDVMIGVGRLMGVAPPENFWLPFLSPNIAQYWLRVHRSLTEWLTDYVFHPVYTAMLRAGAFGGRTLTARSLAIAVTMLVAGVWHGTTISFLLFGVVHALYQVAYRWGEHALGQRLGRAGLRELRARRAWAALGTGVTFAATATAYVFFVLSPTQLWELAQATWGSR